MIFLLACSLFTHESDAIREARQIQNRAMASGDTELAASYWTEDVTLRRGLGSALSGKEAYRALLGVKGLIYTREPELIEVSPDWPLAYEAGHWTARPSEESPIAFSGRYSAQWVKRDERWLIRSEVFVALHCHEAVNSWPALP